MKTYLKSAIMVLIGLLHYALSTSAQSQLDSIHADIVKDYRIDLLVKKQAQINRVSVYKNSRGEYKGFRLMVMNTNSRELAYKTRADILRYFPEYNVYMAYQAPYFKIKMGDFLKRADAEKLKKSVASMFKQGTFVMQDIIKVTAEEEERLMNEEEPEKF